MSRLYALLALAVVIAAVGGTWAAVIIHRPVDQFTGCRTGAVAGGHTQIGGSFELMNPDGEIVTERDVIREPTLIYFGYTFCPDVCPLDTTRNAEAIDILAQSGYSATPVFISIDPERDTPDVVGEYVVHIHDKLVGLTGTLEQVKGASEAFRTYYRKHQSDDDFYLVDHSTFSYLVLPEHGFVEYFRRGIGASELAETIACFIDKA